MEINEIIANVLAKVPDESKTAVEGQLKQIERSYAAMVEDVRIANSESKDRRLKLRDVESKLSEYETEIEQLKNDTTVADLTKQVEGLKSFQSQIYKQNRDTFKNKVDTYSKNSTFEKVTPLLSIPVKDDKFDFDAMDDTAVKSGLEKLNEYEQLGIFETQTPHKPGMPPRVDQRKSSNDISGDELIRLGKENPAEAARILTEKGYGDSRFSKFLKH